LKIKIHGGNILKELIPACPECKTNKYVVHDRTAEKIGTASGGLIGAISVVYVESQSKTESGAIIGSFVGNLIMPGIGSKVGAATGAIVGFLSGSATGQAIGEVIDSKIRMKYRCCNCGTEIQG
jgi:outer membrane lipoprotein SlyB